MTVDVDESRDGPMPPAEKRLKLVDCDVHPIIGNVDEALSPYLSHAWRRHFEHKGGVRAGSSLSPRFAHPNGFIIRPDAADPSGAVGGSNPHHVVTDHLDRYGIDAAILNDLNPGAFAAVLAAPDESIALCTAFNSHYIDHWLPVDPRFTMAISVPSQDPAAAAAEVERSGAAGQVCAVALPLMNTLAGQRYYYPVYEAAEALGLPILLHVTGTDVVYQGAPTVTGLPESYVERYTGLSQIGAANLTSIIFSGTLERFPGLRFAFVEYGFSWALPLMWRMDKAWQETRLETPWVRKPPSEYVRERIRFTTQPMDEPATRKHLYGLIEMLGPEVLMFSTDYPHWDNDSPEHVLRGLPDDAKSRIFADNAAAFFPL